MATFRRQHHSRGELKRSNAKIDRYLRDWAPPEPKLSLSGSHHRRISNLIARDGPKCYLCGRTLDRSQYHIEHIIPRSRGGTNHPSNLAVACVPCNYRKGDAYVSIRIADRIPCLHLA
jgi:5-methylcytosine-specific restriction endonuclease McrA